MSHATLYRSAYTAAHNMVRYGKTARYLGAFLGSLILVIILFLQSPTAFRILTHMQDLGNEASDFFWRFVVLPLGGGILLAVLVFLSGISIGALLTSRGQLMLALLDTATNTARVAYLLEKKTPILNIES